MTELKTTAEHWPALIVQEDRAAALTQGLANWRQAERGGEGVRVRPHGAVSTHFVRQLTGTLVRLLPSWRQLLPRLGGGIGPNPDRQTLALQGGAAGHVPLLILVFLLGCWGSRAWSGIEEFNSAGRRDKIMKLCHCCNIKYLFKCSFQWTLLFYMLEHVGIICFNACLSLFKRLFVPSASAAGVPAYGGALWGDVPQGLLILPLDAGIGHPGQNQSGPKTLILLHVHTQITCRAQKKN